MSSHIEILDQEKILSIISKKNRTHLAKLDIFNTIDSTNTYLLKCAKLNSPSGHAVIANHQTAARGREGKKWISFPNANIYFSFLWRFKELKVELSGLAVAVAVMVARVLAHNGVKHGVQLKWPNDIFFANKKLAGILLESNAPSTVVIGIGINLYLPKEHRQNELSSAISLCEINHEPAQRNFLIGQLLNELIEQLPVFETNGLVEFIQDWRKFDYLLNKNIIVYTPQNKISGIMNGINENGELLLRSNDGTDYTFRYGTVSVRAEEKNE